VKQAAAQLDALLAAKGITEDELVAEFKSAAPPSIDETRQGAGAGCEHTDSCRARGLT
jgi:hypothetical protein